ncbi:MAG: hypothetical protein GY791_08085 [Alphaproteobacteria bacterium]|nr:hypothetical protein [Alphaproteobacteria bacterium]
MTLGNPTKLTALAFVLTLLAVSAPALLSPVHAVTEAQQAKMKAMNALDGRTFDYEVAGYRIRVEFLAEDKLRWTYLEAPDGQQGKTAEEALDRRDIHYGIVLLSWTEDDGTSVIDIFDLQTMTLHANAVLLDGQRLFTKAAMTEVK